jgi:hypothetical protein
MRLIFSSILVIAIYSDANAGSNGADVPQPVNVVVETGQDAGPCTAGGHLSYPSQPYKGSSHFVLQADSAFAARHANATKGAPLWIQQLRGPSSTNRLFSHEKEERVLVFSICKPHDCGNNFAYGAFGLLSHDYLLQITEGDLERRVGSTSAPLNRAIACAREYDDRLRRETAEQIRRVVR